MAIQILLVDDHKILRDGLRTILESKPDIEVIAEAENGREAVKIAASEKPDIVVMDIAMPDLNGIEATRMIVENDPEIRVIALSMHSDKRYISGILKAGASGYLLKHSAGKELLEAIRLVYANHTYLSQEISDVIIKDLVTVTEPSGESDEELTTREKEVLQLIAEGTTTKEIAGRLHLSIKTIETHRQKIMHKLNIYNIPDLTKYAIRVGLTQLDM